MPPFLPIGLSDFKELIEKKYYFVDKSLFIQKIFSDGAKVILIPRPRRFGKTLNLSMAHYFFNCITTENNAPLFKGLLIQEHADCMAQQGAVPSIFLTFKEIKADNYEACLQLIQALLGQVYDQYMHLLESDALSDQDKVFFKKVLTLEANEAEMKNALKMLTKFLHAAYGKQVMIFLDEYDAPIHSAYVHEYYDKMIGFMRVFMGAALKDNIYLQKSVITGVLRVAQASIFSDLNNVITCSLLRRNYAECFGFTQEEVDALLAKADLLTHSAEIKNWYNGYQVKGLRLYNPWSILNCVREEGILQPYWLTTSDNILIKQLVTQHRQTIQPQLEALIQYGTIERPIDENIVFPSLGKNMDAFWSLLLFAGYLTVNNCVVRDDGLMQCQVSIPNQEIMTLYVRMIREWFTETLDISQYDALILHLVQGNISEFQAGLQDYIRTSGSYFDFNTHTPEAVYHAFMLGLVVGLRNDYIIQSNREAGSGRCDLVMIPKDPVKHNAMILEFKRTDDPKALAQTAQDAVNQILKNDYGALLASHAVKNMRALGIAFAAGTVHVVVHDVIL